jgi:hypothetical protein
VLVASAHVDKGGLNAVLYPGLKNGFYEMGLANLKPREHYRVSGAMTAVIEANSHGVARFSIQLNGRTSVNIYPEEKF